jgi:outer membrane protein TolC
MQSLIKALVPGLVGLGLVLIGAPAAAQQPLSTFIAAAEDHALDIREAEEVSAQAGSRVDEARARLLPSFTTSAGYTRNEYEVIVTIPTSATDSREAVITPYDQLQATFALTIPLVDVGAWLQLFSSETSADASALRASASVIDVDVQVVQAYYQLVAARAVRASAERAVLTADENAQVASARAGAGLASEVDLERARTDAERARQTLAEADLEERLAARTLLVLSGLEAESGRASLADDLHPEPALDLFLDHVGAHPRVEAAARDVVAAEQLRDAGWMGLLPTLAGFASERVTNAAGFGPGSAWSLGVTLSWTLDFGRPATISTRDHDTTLAEIRAERSRTETETAVIEGWHRVTSLLARARAARAALGSSARAAEVARARFTAGTGTQLEVSQAERDALSSEVQQIQADADLIVARYVLRLRAGLGLGGEP